MNEKELKRILYEMRSLVDELESAVLADTSNYKLDVDYDDVLKYYQTNDDDDKLHRCTLMFNPFVFFFQAFIFKILLHSLFSLILCFFFISVSGFIGP